VAKEESARVAKEESARVAKESKAKQEDPQEQEILTKEKKDLVDNLIYLEEHGNQYAQVEPKSESIKKILTVKGEEEEILGEMRGENLKENIAKIEKDKSKPVGGDERTSGMEDSTKNNGIENEIIRDPLRNSEMITQ
jgi:hypothetical protein